MGFVGRMSVCNPHFDSHLISVFKATRARWTSCQHCCSSCSRMPQSCEEKSSRARTRVLQINFVPGWLMVRTFTTTCYRTQGSGTANTANSAGLSWHQWMCRTYFCWVGCLAYTGCIDPAFCCLLHQKVGGASRAHAAARGAHVSTPPHNLVT